jgi:hypothetical protein
VAAPSIADAAFASGSRIGRYFALVSAVPSALLVFFVYALVKSGAWSARPDPAAVGRAVSHLSLGEFSLLLVVALGFGLASHPLQFAVTQFLEGYWGTSTIGRSVAVARVRRHRARMSSLVIKRRSCQQEINTAHPDPVKRQDILQSHRGDAYVRVIVEEQAYRRALMSYPEKRSRVMPTRLGNVLRRYEDAAGAQYGLDAITTAPHLALVARPEHIGYLHDAREQLDLAVRLCMLSLIATVLAFMFLVGDDLWLLIAALPYGLAYLSYRGAVLAAHEYGTALATLIDLDRFRLYSELHLRMPVDTAAERIMNAPLMRLLTFKRQPDVVYEHPADSSLEVRTGP